ncbi:MAG: WecB/TagA/CpsF family glycosyltransferase [Opitutaceae bacterium]|jgi:exopolysaccharide biosynthesis WecB/TagA/CpsF family protein|nr:WecB/TagA/CpsF family glycosyltransferase [Opitutaceae bacterium]
MSAVVPPKNPATRRVLGVEFFNGALGDALETALAGGLMVVPSGPGLATDLVRSAEYREALMTADLVLTDSGFMVLLWRLFTRDKLPRNSGLAFIRALLRRDDLKAPGAIFWVMPSPSEALRNKNWLNANGFSVTDADIYVAPHYGKGGIRDEALLERLNARAPRVVLLAVGGGVQERLGNYLRNNLAGRPAILCLGAAIAFVTGGQAAIPVWADRLCLGWLLRILRNPRRYWRRYRDAFRLAPLLWKYRDNPPPGWF